MDASIDFTVSLDRAATKTFTVDYETSDGSAIAGEDYDPTSGTLTFEVGDQEKIIAVPLLDDAIDEGEETFRLVLSNAVGGRIEDGEATGTIENSDPLQQAWIARFGRTVASQAVDAIGERFAGGGATHVTLSGQSLGAAPDPGAQPEAEANARAQAMAKWLRGEKEEDEPTRTLTGRELLLGSSFSVNTGGEGPFTLTGEAASNRKSGTVQSTLSAVYPYLRLSATERLDFWAMGGYGSGTMTIAEAGGTPLETDIGMTMGAVGMKGTVLEPPPEGGLALKLKTDALFVRMESDALRSEAGHLEGAQANVSRLRLVLEGSRAFALGEDGTLTPAVEVGLRQDGGDAETGTGLELGGRLSYTRPGVTVEGAVRALVAHEESGYEEWGASGAVRIDPGTSGRGLSFTLAPTWGAASSGIDQLWRLDHTRSGGEDQEVEGRLETQLGYGLGVPGARGVVTPYAGLSLAGNAGRTLRAGTRWHVASGAVLGLEGSHQGGANGTAGTTAIQFRTEIRW